MFENQPTDPQIKNLIDKLEHLPQHCIPEVDLFLDFLRLRDHGESKLTDDYARLSMEVWDDD